MSERFRPREPQRPDEKRRRLLVGLGTAGAMAAAGLAAHLLDGSGRPPKPPEKKDEEIPEEEIEDAFAVEPNPQAYPSGKLQGYRLNDLFTNYTGVQGLVGPTIVTDFKALLANMMRRKMVFIKAKEEKEREVIPQKRDVLEMGKTLFREYKTRKLPTRMELRAYVGTMRSAVAEVRESLDWERLGRGMKLSPELLKTLRVSDEKLSGRHFLSYVLTELMPGYDGRLNWLMLEFLLRHAGREYIESIPAMSDPEISFGPAQMTPHAVSEKNGAVSASLINRFTRTRQIPPSVAQLRGDAHFKAMYLFTIFNLQALLRKLPGGKAGVALRSEIEKLSGDELLEYVATAHHAPRDARKAFSRYLDARVGHPRAVKKYERALARNKKLPEKKRKKLVEPKRPDYLDFASAYPRVLKYVRQTRANNKELAQNGL